MFITILIITRSDAEPEIRDGAEMRAKLCFICTWNQGYMELAVKMYSLPEDFKEFLAEVLAFSVYTTKLLDSKNDIKRYCLLEELC